MHGPTNAFGDKSGEGGDDEMDARVVQRRCGRRAIIDADYRPWICDRSQHCVHQKAYHASVSVGIGMDISEHPVAQDSSHTQILLPAKKLEQRWHRLADRFPARRQVPGGTELDGVTWVGRGAAEDTLYCLELINIRFLCRVMLSVGAASSRVKHVVSQQVFSAFKLPQIQQPKTLIAHKHRMRNSKCVTAGT